MKQAMQAVKANPGKSAVAGGLAAAMALATPLVAKWEGKRNDPYVDIVGVRTVCYGETRVEMRRYSDAECRALLTKGLEQFAAPVIRCTPILADKPYQLAAATSLAYNVGTGAYCRSTVARRFNAGNIKGACDAFMMWTKVGVRTVQGLVNRRRDERALCLRGVA